MLPDLHRGFSRSRSGGLVFPSLSEFSTVYCDPHSPKETIQYHGNPSYAQTISTEEAEVERFYEDLQDLLELTPKKGFLFIIGDWNAKIGSQETPGVTGKFRLGVWNEAVQRLIEFCQENATGHGEHPHPTTQEKTLHMDITRWSTPKSD